MTKIVYPASSAYAATSQTNWAIGRYVHRSIPADSRDTDFDITAFYEHRPDKLSMALYGRDDLGWVFVTRNIDQMRDMIWDLKAGMTIIVPAHDYLKELLGI